MKPNYKNLSVLLFGAFYIVGMLYLLYGCKNPQTIYKTEYKTIKDTLIVNGDTIIRNIEVKQDCPECEEKTRFETRLEYRLDKRKLNALKSMYEDSLREARKINNSNNEVIKYVTKWKTKSEVKQAKVNVWNWFFGGCAVAFGISLLIRLFIFKR
jgi:arginine decarboxylase-like protein